MHRILAALVLVGGLSTALAQSPGANENALVTQAQAAMQARSWQAAETAFRQLVAIAPARWEYQEGLGAAQYNQGRFEDALASYEKAIPLARRDAQPPSDKSAEAKAAVAQMLTTEGNIYLKLRKSSQAIDAYTKAAALSSNPAVAYFNLCADELQRRQYGGGAGGVRQGNCGRPNQGRRLFHQGIGDAGERRGRLEGQVCRSEGDGGNVEEISRASAQWGARIGRQRDAECDQVG